MKVNYKDMHCNDETKADGEELIGTLWKGKDINSVAENSIRGKGEGLGRKPNSNWKISNLKRFSSSTDLRKVSF